MTSDEQARGIAEIERRIEDMECAHAGDPYAPDDAATSCAICAIRFLLAALRTREAETWEQAAQVVNSKSVPDFNSWLVGPAEVEHELRVRARAAQPQEPTKATQ